jgi:alkylated DNA repair dioxygenase AlkB
MLVRTIDMGPEAQLRLGSLPADELPTLEELKAEIPWVQPEVRLYGKVHKPLRQVATMGKPYAYNGNAETDHTPVPPLVASLMARIGEEVGVEFNTCVANFYPNGEASIAAHSDGEQGTPCIASVSLGSSRRMTFARMDGTESHSFTLAHGTVAVMEGPRFQRDWKHAIPKQAKVTEPRISLTFRQY